MSTMRGGEDSSTMAKRRAVLRFPIRFDCSLDIQFRSMSMSHRDLLLVESLEWALMLCSLLRSWYRIAGGASKVHRASPLPMQRVSRSRFWPPTPPSLFRTYQTGVFHLTRQTV